MDLQEIRKRAAEIMGEIFMELSRREELKKRLGAMDKQAARELVRAVVNDIEILVERQAFQQGPEAKKAPKAVSPVPPPVPADAKPGPTPVPVPSPHVATIPSEPGAAIVSPSLRDQANITPQPAEHAPDVLLPSEDSQVPVKAADIPKVPFSVPSEGFIYLHAVGALRPNETPSSEPFQLEEKGIDGRNFAFAWDHNGLRYFLSMMPSDGVSLGRDNALLLPKPESIRLRGVHESVVNDFRLHGVLLPFAFGTVIQGWDRLQRLLIRQETHTAQEYRKLAATRLWSVTVSVLDSRFLELQQHDTPEKRREADRHRSAYSLNASYGKTDLKTLERILNKQRRLAESIHRELEPVADRAELQMMVSVQSGSSDDWKPILKATYEIRPTLVHRFHRLVTDLQYQHFLQELMISLSGDVSRLSVREN